ncbi:nondiscriminating glutamyl-tRNA synthetase EARS2, mitochondrial [Prorops nasuta]|uniref:nondiscriminating glutamyl-tRNA synthetase EARS2, mitochondrial n=1 Tax=Prorops nasuta TaxID=863751 RepID=UPI0034CF3D9B
MQRNILFRVVALRFSQKRFYKKQVRVRFAPSPTGELHIGGLRTALYNYLYARSNDGAFILRIEDTDQLRVVPGAMEKLHDDLLWAGIIPDEDPIRGGPMGPYIQSKRLDFYSEQVLKLLNKKAAYHCFCTNLRLDILRREAIKSHQIPKYDNRCRHLSDEEVKEKLNKGVDHCIRFKLSETYDPFQDMIFGTVEHDISINEGDPVIIKSDGFPTYHFANVVDDHFMEITHVLRGAEWKVSTPKHLMLYKAFGWEAPKYGHLPLLLNKDNTKLSKRQGDIKVDWFRKTGIFPLALINYITHAGGGFQRNQGSQQLYSYEDLIKQFDVTKININSTKLEPLKLQEFNKIEISNLLADKANHAFLISRVKKLVTSAFPNRSPEGGLQLEDSHILKVLQWVQNRITNLSDLVAEDLSFLWVIPTTLPDITEPKYFEIIDLLIIKLTEINDEEFVKMELSKFLKQFAKQNDVSFPTLMKIMRGLLSGLKDGPSISEMMDILGKNITIQRLKRLSLNNQSHGQAHTCHQLKF